MVKCKACGLEHPGGMRCEQAKRLLGKAKGETPLDQPAIPVVTGASVIGVDRPERRPGICPVCEARKAKEKEYMKAYRAVKSGRASLLTGVK